MGRRIIFRTDFVSLNLMMPTLLASVAALLHSKKIVSRLTRENMQSTKVLATKTFGKSVGDSPYHDKVVIDPGALSLVFSLKFTPSTEW